jgi:small subunit ribosomal protein S9
MQPLSETGNEKGYEIKINAYGGGFKGQLQATRLGIARALLKISPDYRTTLRING